MCIFPRRNRYQGLNNPYQNVICTIKVQIHHVVIMHISNKNFEYTLIYFEIISKLQQAHLLQFELYS